VNLPFAPGEDSSHGGVSEAESDRRGRIFDRWTAEAKDLGISGQALRVFMTSRAEATFPPAEEDDPVTGVREVTQ
jgi:hypothetical protein